MGVNFSLEKRTNKEGEAPIRVSITIAGVRVLTSTGYSINPEKWDDGREVVGEGKGKGKIVRRQWVATGEEKKKDCKIIIKHLNSIVAEFDEFESICQRDKLTVTPELINQYVNTKPGKKKEAAPVEAKTFLDVFDTFIKESGSDNNWSIATHKKLAVVRNHLAEFSEELSFDKFTDKGMAAYLTFLREKKRMRNSTVTKQLAILKWFLRWATVNGHNTNTAFQSFKPKLKNSEKRVIFLTWDELMTVYNFDIPKSKEYLTRVRDVFCFCCFTSLRYSDVHNLKRSDIKGNALHITTVKTSDSLIIELNKYSKAILAKYEGLPFEQNRALPVISNQKMNDYLKELGEMCEINEPQTVTYYVGNKRVDEVYPKYELLGTHTGRRTFICNALALGIPAQVVMKWTGHSDYKAMQPYIAVAESVKVEAMNKFNNM